MLQVKIPLPRVSCSESEPVGKEDFSPAGFKTDGAETLKREVSVLLGRCAALAGSLLSTSQDDVSFPLQTLKDCMTPSRWDRYLVPKRPLINYQNRANTGEKRRPRLRHGGSLEFHVKTDKFNCSCV
jgi:hypothetical protein